MLEAGRILRMYCKARKLPPNVTTSASSSWAIVATSDASWSDICFPLEFMLKRLFYFSNVSYYYSMN